MSVCIIFVGNECNLFDKIWGIMFFKNVVLYFEFRKVLNIIGVYI